MAWPEYAACFAGFTLLGTLLLLVILSAHRRTLANDRCGLVAAGASAEAD